MRERLVIRLQKGHSRNVSWVPLNENGRATANEEFGSLSEVSAISSGRHITIIAPGSFVSMTKAKVPAAKKNRIAQMVPFAVEEFVADDLDYVHFGIGDRNSNGEVPVAIVGREMMDFWHDTIMDSGIRPHEIIPEQLCLPIDEAEWCVLIDADEILVRTSYEFGFSIDRENFVEVLGHAITKAGENAPMSLRVYDFSGSSLALEEMEMLPDIEIQLVEIDDDMSPLTVMAEESYDAPSVNLLTGQYSLQQELSKVWAPWKPTAILVALLLIAMTVTSYLNLRSLENQSIEVTRAIQKSYKTVSESKKKPSPGKIKRILQKKLEDLESGAAGSNDFIDILAAVSPAMAKQRADIESLNYRKGTLTISASVANTSKSDALENALALVPGYKSEITSLTPEKNSIKVTIKVGRIE